MEQPTQADIAKLAKVHRTTVSLALKNDPRLPEPTRARILKIADKLGYTPDPMLSALIARRVHRQEKPFQGVLAWLANNEGRWDWRRIFHEYHEGATSRAKRYGYNIEIFDLQTPGMTLARMGAILAARNIRGVLVVPQPRPDVDLTAFPWEKFSAVAFGYSLKKPQLHTVGSSQFQGLKLAMRKLTGLGFRRIGFVFTPAHSEAINHHYLGAYLAEEWMRAGAVRIPPFDATGDFRAWYRRHRPEVVIASSGGRFLERIREAGLRVPEDIGMVCPFFPSRSDSWSGVYENSVRVGEVAVDAVVSMIHRGERGVPEIPQRTLIEGVWVPGKTLPAAARDGGK
ncbi:MAG: LacI family transcriptional regulator [Opitutaceae bacterium]|jgi:LacI family transcriptional regulator/LacI family repressor for deo operon, udp, cdd, tsx, nupC, and nupG|nr:LacI family transcriptional regulator [Opitutaceae bacterium]